jgi:glucosamine-6-phosphate deaminase
MNLLRFESESAWLHAISSLWRDRLRTKPDLKMCLPAGTTPIGVYADMSRSVRAGLVSFARAAVFVLDEFGGLAPDDPGRTGHTLQRQLIDSIDLPSSAFHVLDPDASDVARHCGDYDAAIGDGFDLTLLGLGLNGHLGMNEPGSPDDSPTRRVELHETTVQSSAKYFSHRRLPRWGLTVGLKGILGSTEVWLLANGRRKAEIVAETVEGEIGPRNPASLLRRHPNCSLFVDADAAALLSGPADRSLAPRRLQTPEPGL